MKTGRNIVELAREIQRMTEAKRDYIAPTTSIEVEYNSSLSNLGLLMPSFDQTIYPMTPVAQRQIANWAGVPLKYLDLMAAEAPDLVAVNFNRWLGLSKDRRMIRTLDGNARAFLSDRYRRIDHEDVAEVALPILMGTGDTEIVSCDVTENKLYIKALFPRVRGEVAVGDEVQAGVVISNSEIGTGALSIQPLVYRLACKNGMIRADSSLRANHVGGRLSSEDVVSEVYKEDTLRADDRALLLKIRDVIGAVASQDSFNKMIARMREAQGGQKIERPTAAVEVLGKALNLRATEKDSFLENLIRAGDYSRYGALNAVTAIANNAPCYDRATELEELGGVVLDLPAREWARIAEAA
jgi:hypothetical protein